MNNKKKFFEDQSLNYHLIPSDCRTNSFLENYNGYIKSKLGKHRETNWVNFMNFIKDESGRIIDKLYNATSNNLKNLNINEQISTVNPFIFSNINIVEETKSNIKEYTKEKIKENRQNLKLTSEDIDKIINSKLGLTNLGQTYYMNSSLQILIHNEIFLNQISLIKINSFMNEILNEFLEILFAILNYKYNEDNNYLINSYSPIKFKNYFI